MKRALHMGVFRYVLQECFWDPLHVQAFCDAVDGSTTGVKLKRQTP